MAGSLLFSPQGFSICLSDFYQLHQDVESKARSISMQKEPKRLTLNGLDKLSST